VYIDGDFETSLNAEQIARFNVSEGRVLTDDELRAFREGLSQAKLRDTAFRILSRRPHSEKELRDKLLQRGFEKRAIFGLVDEFREKNYLNDDEFAEKWVEDRMRMKPRGRRMLVQELLAKGIRRSTAERIVKEKLTETDQSAVAFELILARRRKFASENWVDTKGKMYNFLRYRGFDLDDIAQAIERFRKQQRESGDESV